MGYQGVVGNYLMFFIMEKVEKRLMDFSGVFVYNYFEIKLMKYCYQFQCVLIVGLVIEKWE